MKTVLLGELIAAAQVRRAGSADLPVLSMTMHGGLVNQSTKFKKRVASADTSDYKVIGRGQLVVGFPIDEGVLDFQDLYPEGIVSPAYGVWDLKDENSTDRDYLRRFLRSPIALSYYKAKLRGSTARRRSLPTPVFLELPVPHPALKEQRRIAAILDHADSIQDKSRQSLLELDDLNRSAYLDAFGDPMVTGPDRRPIREVAEVITGNTPSRADGDNFGQGIEWIKSDNLGGLFATQADERLSPSGEARARTVPPGSMLVTCIAGSPNSIGKASLVDRRVAFNQQINAVRPGPEIDSRFLLEQLKVSPNLVRQKSTGGMKGLVSKSNFMAIEVHVPPIREQLKFVNQVRYIDEVRERYYQTFDCCSELLAALQARAFSGRL